MDRPGEYWITKKNVLKDCWEAYEEPTPASIHVVDKSKYDESVKMCKEMYDLIVRLNSPNGANPRTKYLAGEFLNKYRFQSGEC